MTNPNTVCDVVTGVATRAALIDALDESLREGGAVGVVHVALDRLRVVNHAHGHDVGDQMLRHVAARLAGCVRAGDVIARFAGGEFMVLRRGAASPDEMAALARVIERSLAEPIALVRSLVHLSAATGVAWSDDESTSASVIADAVDASKRTTRERAGIVCPQPDQPSASRRWALADDLRRAVERGEIFASLQPIVDIADGRVRSVEALARWRHPTEGTLAPHAFLGLVEDLDLSTEIGDAIARSACATLARVRAHGVLVSLALNLSPEQLADPTLCARLQTIVAAESLSMDDVIIEITEHALLSAVAEPGRAAHDDTLCRLRRAGARLALDDFGAGYSSLAHLSRFPIAQIKIDQRYIAGLAGNRTDRAVVEMIIGLGRALDVDVVAEGVETEEQMRTLRSLGCPSAQGHLITAALAPDDAAPWLFDRARRNAAVSGESLR